MTYKKLLTEKERAKEVRVINALEPDEVIKRANGQLVIFDTLDEVYDYLAEEMVKEFAKAAKGKKVVNFIMPVGPPYGREDQLPQPPAREREVLLHGRVCR